MNARGRTARRLAPLGVAIGLLACSDDGSLGPVALESIGDGEDEAAHDATDGDPTDGTEPDGEPADGAADAGDGEVPQDADDPTGTATPGTIDLAGAGTVRIEVVDDRLQLQAVEPAVGWRERGRQVEDDEVEVELARDAGGDLELEVELDDGRVQVSWTLEAAPVEPGTIPLGEAGELVVSVSGEELVVEALRLAEGWQVVEEDVDDDELELELVRGDAVLEVDLELGDGALELTLTFDSGERPVASG